MQNDTFQTILKLSDERFQLYLLAGHQRLMPEQSAQIDEITGRLATLWDQYRRELAAGSRESKERVATLLRYESPEVRRSLLDDDEDRRAA